jgi:hypothetical protein
MDKRNATRVLVKKPKGKIPLGRPRRRWDSNINMDLKEMRWEGAGWIDLTKHGNKLCVP